MIQRVGIVVPTLGERPEYLLECLQSIRKAGRAHVLLVAPNGFDPQPLIKMGFVDQFVLDGGHGLPEAINRGVFTLPAGVEYVNWLGDDDLIAEGSIDEAAQVLDSDPKTVLVYGSCEYIDSSGKRLWLNRSGRWASPLLHFGPDLIPQPGALFRKKIFDAVGGLSSNYDWAFDFDFLLNVKRLGKLKFHSKTMGSFRWHPSSLSVQARLKSVEEASRVRTSHLPKMFKAVSFLWEYPVKRATLLAGHRLTERANQRAR